MIIICSSTISTPLLVNAPPRSMSDGAVATMCTAVPYANFRTELALRTHFKTRQCRHDFEGRVSKISTPKGKSAKLRYFTKTSCELSPVIVYADFEVFSQNSIQFAAAEGVQNRIAAAAYSAVGMCGYEPPEAHKLWMEHAREGEHECAVALQFLRSLMGLLDHYKNWRMNEKKPLVWTAEHRTQHQQARECRECRRVFCNKSGRRKVAHHDHGTGSWLGALRENCNQAAHVPYDITICFHNGGRYDFHFVLRALAKFKYHAKLEQNRRAVAGKIRKFGVKELARRVKLVQERAAAFGSSKSKPLLACIPHDKLSRELLKSPIALLQKSAETNLTMKVGHLRFVDTINFCNSGLGALIDSQRRSAEKKALSSGASDIECLESAFRFLSRLPGIPISEICKTMTTRREPGIPC